MQTELVTMTEAAKLLGVGRSHVYRLVNRGALAPVRDPLYRKGGPVFLERAAVERLRSESGRWVETVPA